MEIFAFLVGGGGVRGFFRGGDEGFDVGRGFGLGGWLVGIGEWVIVLGREDLRPGYR